MNIFNILSKEHLTEMIQSWENESIFGSENFANCLMDRYVFGQNSIPDMSKEEIFYECIGIYCSQARKGAIHSKWCIASHLLGYETYLSNDLVLASFLINLAAYENEPNACKYMAHKYKEFDNQDIAEFWEKKAQIGFTDTLVGEAVDIVLDTEYKAVYIR